MEHAKEECRKGHPLQGDNKITIRNPNGTTSVRCLRCQRDNVRAYQARQRQKRGLPPEPRPYRRREREKPDPRPPRPPRRIKTQCAQGHPLSGSNVKIVRNADGTSKRRCVTCERASHREYQRRQRAKALRPPVKSFADKLALSIRPEGDCHIWTARLDKGHPTICRRKRYTRVRKLLYVARFGPLKYVRDTAPTCGNKLCVNEAHIIGIQRELRLIGARIMCSWDEIQRYARRQARDQYDSDDIAMAAVAATYEQLQRGAQIENVVGFMRSAVRNAIIDQARRFKLAPMTALSDAHDTISSPADTTNPLLICEREEHQRKTYASVMRRVGYRSQQAARVLKLRLRGLSAQQIGDKLGITVHTVERHMNTARRIALPPQQKERVPHEPIAAVLP